MAKVKELEGKLREYKEAEKAKIRAEKRRFRRFLLWIRYFLVGTWKWLLATLVDWKSWIIFLFTVVVMGSTVWIGFLLYWIFGWPWALAMATSSLFFWNCVPFTPFIPICLVITAGIKGIIETSKKRSS